MSLDVIFSIFLIIAFLIIGFPIIMDIIKIVKFKENIDRCGLVRRSITLSLVFAYISMVIYNFIFSGKNDISEDFRAILLTVIGYYFGKSTALDDPSKSKTNGNSDKGK